MSQSRTRCAIILFESLGLGALIILVAIFTRSFGPNAQVLAATAVAIVSLAILLYSQRPHAANTTRKPYLGALFPLGTMSLVMAMSLQRYLPAFSPFLLEEGPRDPFVGLALLLFVGIPICFLRCLVDPLLWRRRSTTNPD